MTNAILLTLALAIGGVLVFAAFRPDTFRIARSITIAAPPDSIYPLLSDLREAQRWSPYERRDPAMKRSFSAATSGVGARYEFDGNREVGAGTIEITRNEAPRRVVLALRMTKPMKADNVVEYTLERQHAGTVVTWAMSGHSPFIARVMCLFFSMDRMVGRDFEAGLATLKSLVEGPSAAAR
jgi:uncharacterized protein YndB with AHSA1/START domain